METARPITEPILAPVETGRQRLSSLDALRGFLLLAMASMGLGAPEVARRFPENRVWQFVGAQFSHVAWRGCTFWDLIQPAFMFMVGISMVYSFSGRREAGHSFGSLLARAIYRSVVLAMLGIMLAVQGPLRPDIVLTNVLTQIGLGYTFLFLLWNCRARWQLLAGALILIGDWAAFYLYPTPPDDFDYGSVGVPANWPHLQAAEAHWDKNTNVAADLDRIVLNWLPRHRKFEYSSRGYATLNFVPALTTMIFGLLAGGLLHGERPAKQKLLALIAAALGCLIIGVALDATGYCPMVKRIWTPSWTIFSAGWALLALGGFYAFVDLLGFRRLVWPLTIAGMNPLVLYCVSQAIGWPGDTLAQILPKCLGSTVFTLYGAIDADYAPIVQMTMIVAAEWLICVWLYRRRIFVRL